MDANVISEAEAVLKVEAELGWLEDSHGKMGLKTRNALFVKLGSEKKILAPLLYYL